MKTITTILGGMVVCAWSGLLAWAAPPYINYQGLLNGADGQPLPTGTYAVEFNIHSQASGGTRVWGPFLFDGGSGDGHGPLVPVANGRFNVIIGPLDTNKVSISTVFGEGDRFMEISVNGWPIVPRQQFLSTAYAFALGNDNYELTSKALKAKGTNAMTVGDGLAPASGSIQYHTNTATPSLLIRGAGASDPNRRITLSGGTVAVTNMAGGVSTLAVAGDASVTGNLIAGGNATIGGMLRAASLTDGSTRTQTVANIVRSDPPLVISVITTNDSANWALTNVDLSVLGNDEDGCRIRIYMQNEREYDFYITPLTMDIWFEQQGFAPNPNYPSNVKMCVQLHYWYDFNWYERFDLADQRKELIRLYDSPLILYNYRPGDLNIGGTPGPVEANRFNLWFAFHPNISAKIMVFDN